MIDSGLVKTMHYDAITDTKCLALDYISKASACQRKGRVGRTCKGFCYRLYSKSTYDSMQDHPVPEIKRIPLTELCLRTKTIASQISIANFIADTIQPPPAENVHAGIATLIQVGALDTYEELTKYGEIALHMSVDVRLVKALIFSLILRCYEPVMRIVAMLSVKPPFQIGLTSENRTKIAKKKLLFVTSNEQSDLRFLYNVYNSIYDLNANVYRKADFCKENFISYAVMHSAKECVENIKRSFKALGFHHTKNGFTYGAANVNQNHWELVDACFVAAYYPNAAYISSINGQYSMESIQLETMVLHSSSALQHRILNMNKKNWIVFKEKDRSQNSSIMRIKDCAIVSPMTMLIFAGRSFEVEAESIVIDGVIRYSSNPAINNHIASVRNWLQTQFETIVHYAETYGMVHEEGRKINVLSTALKRI